MRKFLLLFILLQVLPTLAQTPAELRFHMKERTKLQGEEGLEPIKALLEKKPELANTPIPRLNGTGDHLPLNEALFVGDVEVAALLLASGADANAPSGRKGMPPLGWAMNDFVSPEKTRAMVVLLLEKGADPNLGDKVGNTALHRWAARRSLRNNAIYAQLLDLLTEAGADPQAANQSGFTPLMIAVTNSNAPAVELLLSKGADPDRETRFGSARHMAEEQASRPGADPEATRVVEVLKAAATTTTTGPDVKATPGAKETPKATATPKTKETPKATATPKTKEAPKSTVSPKAKEMPKATATPKMKEPAKPAVEATPTPEDSK